MFPMGWNIDTGKSQEKLIAVHWMAGGSSRVLRTQKRWTLIRIQLFTRENILYDKH